MAGTMTYGLFTTGVRLRVVFVNRGSTVFYNETVHTCFVSDLS